MKSPLELIVQDIQQVRGYTLDLLNNLDDRDWFRQPAEGINHVAWQVGHIAIAQYGLCLRRIRGTRPADDDVIPVAQYAQLFGKGSTPSSDPSVYPSPAEIREKLDAVQQQVLLETPQLELTVLDEPQEPPHPMFSTKGESLRFSAKHEMLHAGQIGLLRRLFGLPILK